MECFIGAIYRVLSRQDKIKLRSRGNEKSILPDNAERNFFFIGKYSNRLDVLPLLQCTHHTFFPSVESVPNVLGRSSQSAPNILLRVSPVQGLHAMACLYLYLVIQASGPYSFSRERSTFSTPPPYSHPKLFLGYA
eukprot:GHVO01020647.1.p1 GENE.GHVO01020647.1~~GHVO01020647.1.p1  ORF type:complete len:136 (-),score=7.41 GHVO01020647.1:104-511(-)